jgi:hypothetical protein
MVLVHLYYQQVQFGDFLGKLLGEYTRFAAGGFIFVSGLSIGVIFWPRAADDSRRSSTYKSLWRRSIYVLAAHFLCALVFAGIPATVAVFSSPSGNMFHPFPLIRDIFLLRDGGDLLPFYVLMIALSPLLLQTLRWKAGWIWILVASLSLYTWGLWHPWAFAPAQHQNFPPVLWQAVFVLGLLLGWAWPKYNAISTMWKSAMAIACWLTVGALFVMEFGYQWGMPQFSFGTAFIKVPLSTPEALRYLSIIFGIITTTDVLWPIIGETAASAFVQTLGRKSLPVYVVHTWVVVALGALAVSWSAMGARQILFAPVAILGLWFFALMLDVSGHAKKKRPAKSPARQYIFGPEPMAGAAQ